MNPTILALTARALLGRRRVLLLLPMPLLLIGLTLIATGADGAGIRDWGPAVFGQLGIGVILPLTALVIGASVLGLEIEDGTITHLLTKPLPRGEIVLAKLIVAAAVTIFGAAVPLAVAGAVTGDGGLAVGLGLGATMGAIAYSAVFLALSLLTRRPVAVGLVYIVLWENVLTTYIGGTRVLSIREYAGSIAQRIAGTDWLPAHVAPVAAVVLAAVVAAGAAVGATARLRSFALTGETS